MRFGKVLVTGGAGFIGSHLTKALLDEGCLVSVLDNLSAGREDLLPRSDKLTFLKGDIRNRRDLDKAFSEDKYDAVVHLAAIHYIPYCQEHPEETIDVNLMGTRNILGYCYLYPPKFFLLASTSVVYPPLDSPQREDFPVGPIDIYGKEKLLAEDLVRLFSLSAGVACVAIRPFNVYGPNETNPHLIPEIINQIRQGREKIAVGNLEPKRDFVFVEDVVSAILGIMKHTVNGFEIFNIGTGEEFSVREILNEVQNIIGCSIEITQDPNKVRNVDRLHHVADISRIRDIIGWNPKYNFHEGLERTLGIELR